MRKKISFLLVSFALTFSITTFFSLALAQGPSLVIESPKSAEVIEKDEVIVRFKVENVTITDFRKNPTPRANQGHLNLWIDQANPTVQNAIQHISKEPYLLTRLQPKEHTLVIELVGNDDSSLKPQVKQSVKFTTTGIPKTEGATQITPLSPSPVQTGGQATLGVTIAIIILIIIATLGGVTFYTFQLEKSKGRKKLTKKLEQ